MQLKRCSKGHFYNGSKHDDCPHCKSAKDMGETAAKPQGQPDTRPDVTMSENQGNGLQKEIDNIPKAAEVGDDVKTIPLYQQEVGIDPVAGWLVCIEGKDYGCDYRIKSGRNFIGRSTEMDICIPGDKSISREKHAVVIYDPKKNGFMLQPGESRELFYLNEEGVYTVTELKAYDIVQMGETKLLFIPLCGERFEWSKKEDEKEE